MKLLGEQILRLVLAYSLALHPFAFAQEAAAKIPTPEITGEVVAKAAEIRGAARSPLARLNLTRANLGVKAAQATKVSSQFVNEIIQFQALLIMMGVAQYQMVKQRHEMERLAHGMTNPLIQSTGSEDMKSMCAANSGNPSMDMLCSGDFLVGLAGGAGLLTASVIVKNLLKLFVQAKNKNAFLSVLSALGSMSLMVVGGQASSMLWSESVKLLPSAEKIERAKGLAGRAGLAFSSKQWSEFAKSEDGALWQEIQDLMFKVLVIDDQLRTTWITNLVRFGLRGELATAIPTLMAAGAAGTVIAGGTLGLLTAGGVIAAGGTVAALSAPVLSFVIGAGLGFIALNIIFEFEVPTRLNRLLQDLRSWSAERGLAQNEFALKATAWRFKIANATSRSETYDQAYLALLNIQLKERENLRNRSATAILETFYELRLEIEAVKQKLLTTQAALKSVQLQESLFVSVDGKILSFKEAKAKLCRETPSNCVTDTLYQVRRFQELKVTVENAEAATAQAARWIVGIFEREQNLLTTIADDKDTIFPYAIAARLSQESALAEILIKYLKFTFGASSIALAKLWPTGAKDAEQAQKDRLSALQDISEYYQLTFNGQKIATSLGVTLR